VVSKRPSSKRWELDPTWKPRDSIFGTTDVRIEEKFDATRNRIDDGGALSRRSVPH
jgi:hypothetical protein